MRDLTVIILAAGQSSRMKSATSKVLHPLAGWSVLRHVLEAAIALSPARIALVTSPGADAIVQEGKRIFKALESYIQQQPLGTGDAVKAALPLITQAKGTVLVLYGDSPLMRPQTLEKLVDKVRETPLVVTAMQPQDSAQYGRIKLDNAGMVKAIVEFRDATEAEKAISLCNAGVMAFDAEYLPVWLAAITNQNAKGEYYLTDTVGIARAAGHPVSYIIAEEEETLGINSRKELAVAEAMIQSRLREKALAAGVGMVAPETVHLSMDTEFGYDVLIHPYVWIGNGVRIGDEVEIKSFSHLEGAVLEKGATVGPFARLRPGAHLGQDVAVGNFVEVKNAHLHEGVKAGHLSYLGDAEIGAHSNVGAGTITCNYDGKHKHKTIIGEDVFIGSDTALVAPVTVGAGVTIAAGSVITDDIPDHHLAIARSRQIVKKDWKASS